MNSSDPINITIGQEHGQARTLSAVLQRIGRPLYGKRGLIKEFEQAAKLQDVRSPSKVHSGDQFTILKNLEGNWTIEVKSKNKNYSVTLGGQQHHVRAPLEVTFTDPYPRDTKTSGLTDLQNVSGSQDSGKPIEVQTDIPWDSQPRSLELLEQLNHNSLHPNETLTFKVNDKTGKLVAVFPPGKSQETQDQTGERKRKAASLALINMFSKSNSLVTGGLPVKEQKEIAQGLINLGADVNFKSNDSLGHSALHAALMSSANPEMIKFLISKGADVNLPSGHDASMLPAVQGGQRTNEQYIVKGSADTPLHYAAQYANDDGTVKILREAGAITDARNKNGKTPLDVARLYGRVRLFLE